MEAFLSIPKVRPEVKDRDKKVNEKFFGYCSSSQFFTEAVVEDRCVFSALKGAG
jgi:hypothetical protein